MEDNLKWTLSGGLAHCKELTSYLENIEGFYQIKDRWLDTVHDCPVGLAWDGGRRSCAQSYYEGLDESANKVKYYNDKGIGFNAVFNNVLLKEEHMNDKHCNEFLDLIHNEMNGVIIGSEVLRKYIKKNFPKLKTIGSLCFCRKDLAFYIQAQKDYDLVVLHPDLNWSPDFIKKLDTSRLEVLVNEACIRNCPDRLRHYAWNSRHNMDNITVYSKDNKIPRCMHQGEVNSENSMMLSYDQLDNLRELGIVHFKLQGRQYDSNEFVNGDIRNYLERYRVQHLLGVRK